MMWSIMLPNYVALVDTKYLSFMFSFLGKNQEIINEDDQQ